jgi:hypothetical protein
VLLYKGVYFGGLRGILSRPKIINSWLLSGSHLPSAPIITA